MDFTSTIIITYPRPRNPMPKDPLSVFGGLFRGCIRDRFIEPERRETLESILVLSLGAACSVVTTYLLSTIGIVI